MIIYQNSKNEGSGSDMAVGRKVWRNRSSGKVCSMALKLPACNWNLWAVLLRR